MQASETCMPEGTDAAEAPTIPDFWRELARVNRPHPGNLGERLPCATPENYDAMSALRPQLRNRRPKDCSHPASAVPSHSMCTVAIQVGPPGIPVRSERSMSSNADLRDAIVAAPALIASYKVCSTSASHYLLFGLVFDRFGPMSVSHCDDYQPLPTLVVLRSVPSLLACLAAVRILCCLPREVFHCRSQSLIFLRFTSRIGSIFVH